MKPDFARPLQHKKFTSPKKLDRLNHSPPWPPYFHGHPKALPSGFCLWKRLMRCGMPDPFRPHLWLGSGQLASSVASPPHFLRQGLFELDCLVIDPPRICLFPRAIAGVTSNTQTRWHFLSSRDLKSALHCLCSKHFTLCSIFPQTMSGITNLSGSGQHESTGFLRDVAH